MGLLSEMNAWFWPIKNGKSHQNDSEKMNFSDLSLVE